MRVINVRGKPLVGVSDMNDAGQDAYLPASGQICAVHGETGMVTKFARNNGAFEFDAEFPPCRLGLRRHSVNTAELAPVEISMEIPLPSANASGSGTVLEVDMKKAVGI